MAVGSNPVGVTIFLYSVKKTQSLQLNAINGLKQYMGKKEKSNTNLQYSNFNYCPLVGYFCYFKSSYKIQLIQKRLKIILNNNKRDYETLLENPIWTTMNNKKMRNLEIEVFKTINKLNLSFMKKNICKKKKKIFAYL